MGAGAGRAFLWAVVVVNALLGVALLVASLAQLAAPAADRSWTPTTAVLVAAVAVGWVLVGAVGFFRTYLHVPAATGRTVVVDTVDGERALVLPWRTTFLRLPAWTAAFAAAVAVVGAVLLLAEGNPGWWILALVAVPVVLFLPDRLLQLARPCRLTLSPRGIGVVGADGDAWLDWDDVQGIAVERHNQWDVIRVVGRDRAPSWRWTRRRRVLHAAVPRGPWVDVPGPALDVEPSRLVDAIAHYTRHPSARGELATDTGRHRVVGTGATVL